MYKRRFECSVCCGDVYHDERTHVTACACGEVHTNISMDESVWTKVPNEGEVDIVCTNNHRACRTFNAVLRDNLSKFALICTKCGHEADIHWRDPVKFVTRQEFVLWCLDMEKKRGRSVYDLAYDWLLYKAKGEGKMKIDTRARYVDSFTGRTLGICTGDEKDFIMDEGRKITGVKPYTPPSEEDLIEVKDDGSHSGDAQRDT